MPQERATVQPSTPTSTPAEPQAAPAPTVDRPSRNVGGLTLHGRAEYCTIRREDPLTGELGRCEVYDPESSTYVDRLPVWKPPAPGAAPDPFMTPRTIRDLWGSGTYVVTQHDGRGLVGGSGKKIPIVDPAYPTRPLRCGGPQPEDPTPANHASTPATPGAAAAPFDLSQFNGAAVFQMLSWARSEAREEHRRELERMHERHRLDLLEAQSRHAQHVELMQTTQRMMLEARAPRVPNPAPDDRIDALAARLDELLERQREAEDDDVPERDDIASTVERVGAIVTGIMPVVGPALSGLFRPPPAPPAAPVVVYAQPNPPRPRRRPAAPPATTTTTIGTPDDDDQGDDEDDDDDEAGS